MKNKIYKLALVLSAFVLAIACENTDDLTGDSVVKPTNPTLSVSLAFGPTESLIETEADYAFTVSLSEPQVAAVEVYLELLPSSTATEGDDFSFPHRVRIPAGATSVSDVITIHADDLAEDTETASIKIGTGFEANVAATNSQTVTFNIMNVTAGDLAVGLDWSLSETITDNFGNEIGAYDAADLRLLLTDVPYTTVFDSADGAGAESYVLSGDAPDGEYYLVADFYAAVEIPVFVNLALTFNQVGIINNQVHNFEQALFTCPGNSDNYFIMAKVTKSGTTYTFEEIAENAPYPISTFTGTATVTADGWADYSPGASITVVEGTPGANEVWILADANPYIANGATAYMIVTINPATGAATVMSNEPFDYGVPINIAGSGSVDLCSGTMELSLDYIRPSDGAFYAVGEPFNLQF
jgi:hypothetical protein